MQALSGKKPNGPQCALTFLRLVLTLFVFFSVIAPAAAVTGSQGSPTSPHPTLSTVDPGALLGARGEVKGRAPAVNNNNGSSGGGGGSMGGAGGNEQQGGTANRGHQMQVRSCIRLDVACETHDSILRCRGCDFGCVL